MRTTRWFFLSVLSVAAGLAQQEISAVNAASQSSQVAPGSILAIRQTQSARILNPDPNHVSVKIRPAGSATALSATLLQAPFLMIWALLPAETPLGAAQVTLEVDGQPSAP